MDLEELTKDLRLYTIAEVLQMYDLTWRELVRIQSMHYPLKEEHNNRELPKYIRLNKAGNPYIVKSIDGEEVYYGTYNSIYEAQIVMNELIKYNWNKNILELILREHNIQRII